MQPCSLEVEGIVRQIVCHIANDIVIMIESDDLFAVKALSRSEDCSAFVPDFSCENKSEMGID